MANVRHVPTVPFAASAMEGAVRKRATLSDTENLAVGAFGGVLETCIQSTSRSRSRARAAASTPLPTAPLGRIRFFVISSGEGVPAAVPAAVHARPPSARHGSARRARARHRSNSLPTPLLSPPRVPAPFVAAAPPAVPLITFKICVQSGKPFPSGVGGWYRGVFAAAAPLAPITACQVAVNGAIERAVTGGDRDLRDAERVGVAMAAGAASSVLYSPVDLVVIQQQKRGLDSPFKTISAITSERGVAGLMRGFSACVVREAIYTAGYLGLAPIAKEYLVENHEHFKRNELQASIVGSCVGGTVAAMLTHPVDTAKTCFQSDMAGGTYPNARTALRKVFAEGGVRALYGGGMARTARLCGAFFVINNVREYAIDWKTKRESGEA